MPHPQSSSTLQNYISSGQHSDSSMQQEQQSNSECYDCQKITKIQNHSSSSSSSSGDDGELVQPLHRHIVEHSRQIQTTILHLQSQIEKLKKANSTKDIVIQQLKTQLKEIHNSRIVIKEQTQQNFRQNEFLRRQKQVQKIRRELIQSSQKAINLHRLSSKQKINDSFEDIDQMKQRLKNIEIKFEDRTVAQPENVRKQKVKYTKKIEISSVQDSDEEKSSEEEIQNHKAQRGTSYMQKQVKSKKNNMKIQKNTRNNLNYQSVTDQQIPSSTTLNGDVKSYADKIQRLQSHIQFCQTEMLWMTNFIISFLRMADKFMTMFKQPVIKQHWSMKKKTKIAWRYTKHILGWFVKPI